MKSFSCKRLALLLALTFGAAGLDAATFVVPADRNLVNKSKAVAIATVVDTHSEATPEGGIRTVTTLVVDEPIKGELIRDQRFELVQLGGSVGNLALVVPGTPEFAPGERALLFLDKTRRNEWTTQDLALGRFDFTQGKNGEPILVRREKGVVAWDERGRPYHERSRNEQKFLNFVRGVARGLNPPEDYFSGSEPLTVDETTVTSPVSGSQAATASAPSAYLSTIAINGVTRPVRWPSFGSGVTFFNRGSQAGWPDGGVGAIQAGTAVWTNDPASNVVYGYGGTTTVTNGLNVYDTVNTVQFNDPNGEIAGSFTGNGTLGVGGYWVNGGTNTLAGETFYNITYGDVVIQDGVSPAYLNANRFNQLLAHELGHTLGFRHSDQGTPSTTVAVMRASLVDEYGANLQQYDRDAVQTVYGSGVVNPSATISSFSPTHGPSNGTRITITGSGFAAGAIVTVAGFASTVQSLSSTQIVATTPFLTAGKAYVVSVTNPGAAAANATQTFFADYADVASTHPFRSHIEAISRQGITTGCGGAYYCPGAAVTRAEMAVFLLRSKFGGGYVPPAATGTMFRDVPRTYWAAAWIEDLARRGVTSGCASGVYCPEAAVTRDQMAAFLLRTKYSGSYTPPSPTGTMFVDVARTNPFAGFIEQLAREGITQGCDATHYCPANVVLRGEMAVFLTRTFSIPLP